MLEKNKIYRAEITSYGADGEGVCRIDGMAVFVPFAAVGDIADIKILKVLKNHAFGKIENLLTPSNGRQMPVCDVYGKCGGCNIMHLCYDAQLNFKHKKVEDCIRRIAKDDAEILPVIGSKKTEKYRNKLQIPVCRDKDGKTVFGFYRPHSHDVVNAGNCIIQNDISKEILKEISGWMENENITPYDEQTHTGVLRHVYMRFGEKTGDIMVCLVVNTKNLPDSKILETNLKKIGVTTLLYNINTEKTNVVLGKKTVKICGTGTITDVLCGNEFEISPESFYQINRDQTEILYETAMKMAEISKEDTVFDLYCGAGTISLCASKYAGKVVGIEIVEKAVENAKKNAERNNVKNAEFYCGDAGKTVEILYNRGVKPDVIIVDPPRKGCDNKTIELLAQSDAKRIVYVSCNPATLARDIALLKEKGFKLQKVQPVDLFPQTAHVESVALLTLSTTKFA